LGFGPAATPQISDLSKYARGTYTFEGTFEMHILLTLSQNFHSKIRKKCKFRNFVYRAGLSRNSMAMADHLPWHSTRREGTAAWRRQLPAAHDRSHAFVLRRRVSASTLQRF
jgi:hypothetical protein